MWNRKARVHVAVGVFGELLRQSGFRKQSEATAVAIEDKAASELAVEFGVPVGSADSRHARASTTPSPFLKPICVTIEPSVPSLRTTR